MTCGEPAHKEPQVTTDEFIARNGEDRGEDTEDTRDDVQVIRGGERASECARSYSNFLRDPRCF